MQTSKKHIGRKKGCITWNKGLKGVFKHSEESRKRMSESQKGKHFGSFSEEHKKNISKAKKGKKVLAITGEKHPNWKGDEVGYAGIHIRIRKQLGTPSICYNCGTETAKKYEWANISGEYKLDLDDWVRLCTSCHRIFDFTDTTRLKMHEFHKGKKFGIKQKA